MGLFVAVVPTAIVYLLLSSADEAFVNLTEMLFSDLLKDIASQASRFIFGIPFAMFMFSSLYSNVEESKNTKPATPRITKGFFNLTFVYATMLPILTVYVLFFISQLAYFTSAFENILPEGITYAQYARKGFFEICAIACLNGFFIFMINVFSKRDNEGKRTTAQRVLVSLTAFFTLIFIATALSKMIMYINTYCLTRLRVYTSLFMILLMLIFIFILIKQIFSSFNYYKFCVTVIIAMTALTAFSDIDGRIAQYNVNSYLEGKTESIDIEMFYELSDSAVEYVYPLIESEDAIVAEQAKQFVGTKINEIIGRERSWHEYNLATAKAKRFCEEHKDEFKNFKQTERLNGYLHSVK